MARPAGVRNQDYEDKRATLLTLLTNYVLSEDIFLPSLRQLAIAAGASEPTLKHYFGDRKGLVTAIFEHLHQISSPVREHMSRAFPSIREAVEDYTELAVRMSADQRYINSHVFAIRESMVDEDIYDAYVRYLVEPGTKALAERLVRSKGGPASYSEARIAASMMISNAMLLAMRKRMAGDSDPEPVSFEHQYRQMSEWMLHGMSPAPEVPGDEA